MRVVVQRCSRAEVRIDGERAGQFSLNLGLFGPKISTLRLKNQN